MTSDRDAMLTVLVPCVSSSTTAILCAGPLLVLPQAERPTATRIRLAGAKDRTAKRRGDGANTFVSNFFNSRYQEAALWREILNSPETRHQKGAGGGNRPGVSGSQEGSPRGPHHEGLAIRPRHANSAS